MMFSNHNRRRLWLLAVLTLVLTTVAGAPLSGNSDAAPPIGTCRQDEVTLSPRGHFFGWMAAAAVSPTDGDHVYLGEGSGFTVLDVSDPSAPSPLGGILLGQGDVSDIVLTGTIAYAVNGDGLRTVDVADPEEPTLMGSVDLTGTMGALAVSGSYAYVNGVVDWTDGWLYVVDISDPEHPALVESYDTPGNAGDIAVVTGPSTGSGQGTVYVADGDDLLVLDVSDPGDPTELGTYTPPEPIRAVQAISTTAYLLTEGEFPLGGGHLRIVDLSDPVSPNPLGSYDALEGGNDLYLVDDTAYVADDDGLLQILDVSDTGDPQLLAAYEVDQAIAGVVVSGGRAYVRGEHGVHVLDVSDPENPDVLGSYERPSAVMDIIVDYPSGYIAGLDKLWTVDMSDPVLPIPVGSAPLQGLVGEERKLALASHPQSGDPLVYVAEPYYGAEIFDVADPADPAPIGEYPTPGGSKMNGVAALGDYAYALTEDSGDGRLRILDISDPTDPTEADVYDTPGDARSIFVTETVTGTSVRATGAVTQVIAFVADGGAGLRLIDVSDPSAPTELSHIDPPSGATTDLVIVADGEAYVGSNTGSTWYLQAFDVTDPQSPEWLAEQQGTGQVNDIDLHGEYVYIGVTDESLTASFFAVRNLLWPASTRQESNSGVWYYNRASHGTEPLGKKGGYQTKDVKSTLTFSILGYLLTYIGKGTSGAEAVGPCAVDARIEPAKAEADGCTLSPLGLQSCECGSEEEITFEHEAVNGWEWDGLNPDPVTCPEEGTRTVIGQFAPFVTLGGGAASSFLCMSDEPPPVEERTQTAFWFSLQASEADTWELTSLTFQASGDGDDAANIEEVRLYHSSTQIGTGTFSGDDGTVTFEFSTIIIAQAPQNFRLDYVFDYEGFEACGAEAKQFDVTVSNLPSGLEPQNYKPGHYSGGASGSVTIGCVVHEETQEGFDTIQEAVDGASEGTTISVCPGDYEENVDVETAVTIQSLEGHEETVVQATDANDHVFHVKQNGTTIKGFTIEGASGADRAGVYVYGGTVRRGLMVSPLAVQDVSILDSYIADNRYGIYLDEAQRTEIKGNYVSGNTASGVMLKSSTESQIEDNSFYLNDEDGIYVEGCQDAAGQTAITQNSVTRNERHGIHLKESSGIDIENNISLSENEQHGVFVESSAGVSIADNPIIKENAERGISLYNCQPEAGEAPNQILGNTITGNKSQGKQSVGIHLDGSTGTVIGSPEKPNTIQSHTSYGISLVNGADDNVIQGNTIKWNDVSGVSIEGSCGNQIGDGNTIGEENGNGVRLANCLCVGSTSSPQDGTHQNEITENTSISGNDDSGIWVGSSCGVRIADNEDVKSNEHGVTLSNIECSADQKVEVSQNIIEENEKSGVHVLFKGSGVWVSNNEISYQTNDGIYVESSSGRSATEGPVFVNNTVEHNEVGTHLKASSGAWVGMWQEGATVHEGGNTIAHNSEAGVKLEGGSLSRRLAASSHSSQNNHIGFNTLEENPVGVYVFNQSDSAEIRDNTIRTSAGHLWYGATDFGGSGILVINASGNNIHQNTTGPDVQEGITLWGASGNTIADNTVQEYDKNGVHLIHGSDNTLTGNTIQAPMAACGWMGYLEYCNGILLESSDANAIGKTTEQANQITGNAEGRGICVIGGQSNGIANNTVGPDNEYGIFLSSSQENTIQSNRVQNNDEDGIHLHSSKGNTIEGNTAVDDNGGHGIYLKWSDGNHIRQNHVEDNGKNGVFLYECKENEDIANNEILENGESGIRLTSSHHNRMTENTITDNARHGIRIKYGRNNEILGKHNIAGNGRYGIYAEGSPRTKMLGDQFQSSIKGNAESGVYLRSSRESEVVRWQIEGNDIGVKIETTSDFNVARNYLKDNDDAFDVDGASEGNNYAFENVWEKNGEESSQTSIHVRDSNLKIIGSTIVEDLGAGIIVEGDSDVSIRKSNIYSNAGFGLQNMNPDVTVDAQDNWWGDPSGPGGSGPGSGEEVTGTVDVSNWRSAPVNLVAVAFPETVLVARGMTGSNQIYLQDSVVSTDTVTVTVSDARGWLLEPGSFTATVETSAIVSVSFAVPADAVVGTSDEVTVTVVSQADPTAVDSTSFRVTTAMMADLALSKEGPESVIGQEIAYSIVVTNAGPDGASGVTITDTLPLTATVVSVTPDRGSCTEQASGVVCDVGTLDSGAEACVDLIVWVEGDEGLYSSAEVSAVEHDPDLSDNFDSAHTVVGATSLCEPITGLLLDGPPTTTVEAATLFIASVEPISATPPITYNWDVGATLRGRPITHVGGLSDTAVFTWSVSGPQTVTVWALNACSVEISATRQITVEAAPLEWRKVYLPLVLR